MEYYEFSLVRKALKEREVLLSAMPHISYPMRFVMPHHQGLRPKWLIRMGLFLYDHLGKRKWLAGSAQINLRKHIVWSFSGVRPLFDDGAGSASAATRDYVLELKDAQSAPLLNVYGGKITTYRKLAEATMAKLDAQADKHNWTAGVALPGGDLAVDGVPQLIQKLGNTYGYLDQKWAHRLATTYGTEAFALLGPSTDILELGQNFWCKPNRNRSELAY